MNLDQYMMEVLRTYAGGDGLVDKLTLGALGLAGETGEVVDAVKKWRYQGHEIDALDVALELGDVLWYMVLLSNAVGYSLSDIMLMNVEKLRRRYPDGFDPARSLNR